MIHGTVAAVLTSMVYGVLIVLWSVILLLYLVYLRRWRRAEKTVTILLLVLAIDSLRTLVEASYFGVFYGATLGLLPAAVAELMGRPQFIVVPKLFNLVSALLITLILIGRWVPAFMRSRSEEQDQIKRLEREVARRKRAERALAQAFLKQDTLLQAIPDIVFMVDAMGRLQKWNRMGELDSGRRHAELEGHLALRWIEPEDRADILAFWQQCREVGESEVEARLFATDGRRCPYLWKGVARYDLEGAFAGVTGIGRDLTGRKRIEQALRDERNFIASVLETVAALVVVVDGEGRIKRFNKACERISGYSFEEVRGLPIWERLFPDEEVASIKEIVCRLPESVPEPHEKHWITKDGSRRLIAWTNTALSDSSGSGHHMICTGVDVTQQRQMEQALQARLIAEEAVSEFSSRFVGTLDFRSALREVVVDLARLAGTSCACVTALKEDGTTEFTYRWQTGGAAGACPLEPERNPAWLQRLHEGAVVVGEREPPCATCSERFTICELAEPADHYALLVPIFIGERLYGWMGLRGLQAYQVWCEADHALLRLIARVISGALVRKAAKEQNERLLSENRQLVRRALAIQEEERAHLARELHDELGQSITAIRADAESICRWSREVHPQILASAEAIAEVSDTIYGLVKDMMGRLRPALLDELGLAVTLRECVAEWNRRYPQVHCDLLVQGAAGRLGRTTRIVAYRIVQESLTNVARHAMASRIRVQLSVHDSDASGTLEVMVSDDGIGMDVEEAPRGLGLLGLRERVLAIGGRFDVNSEPGNGVIVRALLPIGVD